MSESIAEHNSEETTETISSLDVPEAIAKQLRQEAQRRDAELHDLLNDYIMLDPALTLTVSDRN